MINRQILYIAFFYILLFNLNCEETMEKNFTLILWASKNYSEIYIPKEKESDIFKSRYREHIKIKEENILKYYWDEQIIILNYDDLLNNGKFLASGLFSVLLGDDILYWGFNNMGLTAFSNTAVENRENYPSLNGYWIDKKNRLFALVIRPNAKKNNTNFSDYSEEEKKMIQNKKVFDILLKHNKIARGKLDP